jgi:hypothetical protein
VLHEGDEMVLIPSIQGGGLEGEAWP